MLALHGLGGTKGSFLPMLAALADRYRVIAMDLPGFGDSDKPIGAAYDSPLFARAVVDLLDALELNTCTSSGTASGHGSRSSSVSESPSAFGAWCCSRRRCPGGETVRGLRCSRLVRPELGLRPARAAIGRRGGSCAG